MKPESSRRKFLKQVLLAGPVLLSPNTVLGAILPKSAQPKVLSFYNANTQETLSTVYWERGRYIQSALDKINFIMRDFRTGGIKPIDTRLIDLLHDLQSKVGFQTPIRLISGYRCRKTNDMLRRKGRNTAKNSFHIKGQAADIYFPGQKLVKLFKSAASEKAGGVGYYPHSQFIHVDVGPVRYWSS
jgi:uncharacterized protein YcbK (DUF882 family)